MTWIETIDRDRAEGRLAKLYRQIAGEGGQIDNILLAHSLRPRTLEGHLAIYKAALHSAPASLDGATRELLGSYVSALNGCAYCLQHHRAALARRLGSAERAASLTTAAIDGDDHPELDSARRAMLAYAEKLTRRPADMVETDLEPLRAAGLDDASILELNQVVAYFAYANRTVVGLGVDSAGEVLGLHPPDGGESMTHA